MAHRRLWTISVSIFFWGLLFCEAAAEAEALAECPPIESKAVKVEAWMSKRYGKHLRQLRKEFSAMGNTHVTLWVYPAENPSKTVAIGRCVPAYIARHTFRKAIEYSGGVNALVHQGFVSSHWIGVGTSLFSENSLQPITPDQLTRLMDDSFDTKQFQSLYRQLTVQPDKVKAFGLMLDNPKLMKDFNRE
ncbi:MAG: hypothetical protein QF913_02310 [Nitrospinaceae bacterium]|jgi:hypothetical protein|nr:hypothetical protein [Nitrospinaceae bacterium]